MLLMPTCCCHEVLGAAMGCWALPGGRSPMPGMQRMPGVGRAHPWGGCAEGCPAAAGLAPGGKLARATSKALNNNKPRSGKHLSPGPERQRPRYPKHLWEGAWEAEGSGGGPGGARQGLSSSQCPRMVTAERGIARSTLPEGSIQPGGTNPGPSSHPLQRFLSRELLRVTYEAGISEGCGV